MKAILFIILLIGCANIQAQTRYDRIQDSRIALLGDEVTALKKEVVKLKIQDSTMTVQIKAIQNELSKKVISNQMWFYYPAIGRDSILNGIKVGSIIEVKK